VGEASEREGLDEGQGDQRNEGAVGEEGQGAMERISLQELWTAWLLARAIDGACSIMSLHLSI